MSIAAQIKDIRKDAAALEAWRAAGYPCEDPYDTYPNELWDACTQPHQILRLCDALSKACELLKECQASGVDMHSPFGARLCAFLAEVGHE